MTYKEALKTLSQPLIYGDEDFWNITESIKKLHALYARATNISAGSFEPSDPDIQLPSGKAISPVGAAHCLLEFKRTEVFIRGIYKAILKLQERQQGTIHILYAGCGPYATLLTPFTTVFSPEEIQFTLLDIQPTSLQAAKQLYELAGIGEYVREYVLADAATYKCTAPTHMIICEAMLHALMKEPQVAITRNLLPQLEDGGLFIPERIDVTAQLLDMDLETESMCTGVAPFRVPLGNVYSIEQAHHAGQPKATVDIPETLTSCDELYLLTDVIVFGEDKLGIYDCSLTLPIKMFKAVKHTGKQVTFTYKDSGEPGFVYEIAETVS